MKFKQTFLESRELDVIR